jgi:hypothetical protein
VDPTLGVHDAAGLGHALARLYRLWDRTGTSLSVVTRHLQHRAGITSKAWADTEMAVVRRTSAWSGHPYHSVLHHAEVASTAIELARSPLTGCAPLDCRRIHLLLCAALGHDIGFDPLLVPRTPYMLETRAAVEVSDAMRESGADWHDIEDVQALILATEPSARRALRHLMEEIEEGTPSALRIVPPPELAHLGDDEELVRLAALLSDADLMSSAGLNAEWTQVQADRLALETGVAATPAGMLGFLDGLVGASFVSPQGRFMNRNLAAIRDSALECLSPPPRP